MLDKKINNAYPHSQAHLQFAQAYAQTKNCKRACLSTTPDFADTKKTKSFKGSENGMTELKNYLKPLTNKNAQLVTACIVQLANSADFKGSAFNKLCSGLTVPCFESPTDTIHAKR